MGKGNACVHGEYEGLFYVDYDNFTSYILDDDENETNERDYDLERILFEEWIEEFKTALKKRFTSLTECNLWLDREEHAILKNELFFIALEDNEWSVAIKLLQKEPSNYTYHKNGGYYYIPDNTGMQKRHYQNYLNGIEEVLFNFFDEIGTYSGAWMHGTKKRPKDFIFKYV